MATLPLYHFAHMHTQTHTHTNTDGELLVVILGGDGFIHNVRHRGEERTGANRSEENLFCVCMLYCVLHGGGVRCTV